MKIAFERQQELNRIRDGAMGAACRGLTTAEINKLNPSLLRAAPDLYEACCAFQNAMAIWKLDPSKSPNTLTTIFTETIGKSLAKAKNLEELHLIPNQ